ncbi:prepilin-type N-terminal cleavage/methylation domain-containing protein [Candidatus Dojkabacteria bacterium]|nr:prepilin-type N-terminal cleavage/methylation domain-containing protein [Candidatus Dojkabacteria bacterium]
MVKELKNKTRLQPIAKCLELSAFTLLELLLVIAIIAVLAGIIMVVLKPADRLREANQTKYLSNAKDIEKAFNSYVVDNGGNLPTAFNTLAYGYYDICRQGQSGSCVSLDELVTSGKMSSIPVDSDNQTAMTTGFKVKYDPTRKEAIVYSNSEYSTRLNSGSTFTEGLVGHWKMDEANWNGTTGEIKDSSSSSNNGTAVGGVTTGAGKFAHSGNFDAVNDYASLAPTNLPMGSSMRTLTAWIYPRAYSNLSHIVHYGNANTGQSWGLVINSAGGLSAHEWVVYTAYGTVALNQWTHVAISMDSTGLKTYYINGVNVGQSTYLPNTVDSGVLRIGTRISTPTEYFNGFIDEVRIYNRVLNTSEVKALYDYAPPAIAHWRFDEGSGTTATDSSGNALNGVLTGGPTWVTGKYGNAISFDGVDDYVVVSNNPFINMGNGNYSYEAWVNTISDSQNYGNVIGKASWNSPIGFGLVIENDTGSNCIAGYLSNTGLSDRKVNPRYCPVNGTWHHYSVTYTRNAQMILYIDGNLHSSTDISSYSAINFTNSSNIQIGQYDGWFMKGIIDDIRIYNYARTQAQIVKDMNNL